MITALILNSGMGSRMGVLTKDHPKCMTEIAHGETILSRQLRLLAEEGVRNVVMTTGLFDKVLIDYCDSLNIGQDITFIKNPAYDQTNYIYSIYCAREALRDRDIVLMHGDLVFDKSVLYGILHQSVSSMVVSATQPLPEKDFKAVIGGGGRIAKVGIEFFDNALAAQPLYFLKSGDWNTWLDSIICYCEHNQRRCYAEAALNEVASRMDLYMYDVGGSLCAEIDCADDLAVVSRQVRISMQYDDLAKQIAQAEIGRLMVVGSSALNNANIEAFLRFIQNRDGCHICCFSDYSSNPTIEQVDKGVAFFKSNRADAILAIGGGSAIDVAKGIKFSLLGEGGTAKLFAIPTTAGTGSEVTHFAVVYFDGEKRSLADWRLAPDGFVLDGALLDTLPLYQRKCTMLDALCHSVESFWAKGSTEESRGYAVEAIDIIIGNYQRFCNGNEANQAMLYAANLAGRAINITKTTAAHAMSYKLSAFYHLPHGHAVALCCEAIWRWMSAEGLLEEVLALLHKHIGYNQFYAMLEELDMLGVAVAEADIPVMVDGVNVERLRNHPVELSRSDIENFYKMMI